MVIGTRLIRAALAAFLLAPGLAAAQTTPAQHGAFDTSPPGDLALPQGTPAAPYFFKWQGYVTATPVTPGTPFPASSALDYTCTTAGTITVTLVSGNTLTFPVAVSTTLQTLQLAATNVTLGTAVCTFWSMQ